MNECKDEALFRVAEAITDGVPVDWEKESRSEKISREKLGQLRRIEAIAIAHWTPLPKVGRGEAGAGDGRETNEAAELQENNATGSLPPSSWGPLKILEVIGQGSFGEVYRAYDPSLQREVALKLRRAAPDQSDPKAGRFLDEARRLARVHHPNILAVHGADEHDGRVGLWADLLRGKTLEECLAQQGPFSAREAALMGIELCHALAAVHAAGLIHRDIKTSNVMRELGGQIVLMDFGSVSEQSPTGWSGSETISGTPLFMAPEQVQGKVLSRSSDIYGLGVVLYRLVSARFPVEASSFSELEKKHQRRETVPLRDVRPDLPTAFVQAVERALAPEPERRYASAGEMERALLGLLASLAPAETPAAARRMPRRVIWACLAASLALAVLAGIVVLGRLVPGPFTAEATLYRQGEGKEERLLSGGRVQPGDLLFLEIEGKEEMYVYVLNEDEVGNSFILFPVGLNLDNPLSPGVRHRLPGQRAGAQMNWRVTSAGGKETFLVIASRRPLKNLEQDLAQFPRAREGRQVAYAPVSPQSLQRLRGIGGLTEAHPAGTGGISESKRQLSAIARALSARAESSSGIWVRQIQLDNPRF